MKPQLLFLALLSFCAGAHADEPKKSHILDGPAFQSGERRNLIWEDTFESGSWNARKHPGSSAGSLDQAPTWEQSMNQGDYSAKVVESPVREGKYAIRFEWRAENFKGSNVSKKASLFSGREPTAKEERWWGFSLYLPAQGMEKDSQSEILAQWHETPDKGEPWRNPPLTLSHNGGNLQVSWIYDRRKITPPPPWKWDRTTVKIGPAPKDRWIDWVWHIKWDPFGKGVLEVWMDGKKVVDARDISIGMNDERGNYAGIGLYKYSGKSDHAARVIYFDEVRAGSAQATYADVAPGAKPLPQDADTRDRGPSVP